VAVVPASYATGVMETPDTKTFGKAFSVTQTFEPTGIPNTPQLVTGVHAPPEPSTEQP